jgi:preprotein translocase subunit SecD
MRKHVWISLVILVTFGLLTFLFLKPGGKPFQFGLDLVGGTELIYKADTTNVVEKGGAMESLKEVIERRVNVFGVSEPLVQTERAGVISGQQHDRLIVELPGVTDIERAKELIGKTPSLEFRLLKADANVPTDPNTPLVLDEIFQPAVVTGRYLERARVEFDPQSGTPYVSLDFNDEGTKVFRDVTRVNKGEILAIVLDGTVISTPVIQDEITDGKAQITGIFSPEEARSLVRDLNYGALPVPIELVSSQTIGATLGNEALDAGVKAGVIGFIALSLFLILWYRLPGVVSVLALVLYIVLSLVIFKLIPVTLTAAGVAGFILSIGMAVDANVLIFERTKEEIKKGKSIADALHEGFHRAWLSIRDSNISSIITAIVLFWLGTSAVKGFALTLGVGVLVSMLTAISVSRTFLFAIAPPARGEDSKLRKFLFSNGLHK